MSPNDTASTDGTADDGSTEPSDSDIFDSDDLGFSERAEKVVGGLDRRLIDLLAWLLETETRARIYIYLRQYSGSTSDEIATGTGLYPSTVREAIVELHDEGVVRRQKRASEGAGNNPYEYEAIPSSELVRKLSDRVQTELNTVLNLDGHLDSTAGEPSGDAVKITIGESGSEE